MKILHIIDSLGLGGAQTIVKEIFETQKLNKDIFLFVLRKREINIQIDHPNVRIFNSEAKYSFKPLKELKKLIKKEKIEVLHCHLFRSQVTGYLLKKRYFPDIKIIFHEHGKIFTNNLIYNTFLKLSKPKISFYIAISKATKNELIKKADVDPKKILCLYNFIDTGRFNRKNIKLKFNIRREREKLRIKNDEFVIGFVGRLSEVKGCEYLIKSLPYLCFPYKVLIAGDGPEREKLKRLARRLNVQDKIIFLGYRKDIIFIYSLLNLLVMPSLSESFGLSVVEAQSMKTPVIVSNVPALNEIIQDKENGLLFEAKNGKDLAKKIDKVYKNRKLREKLVINSLRSVKKYSLKEYLKKMNKIYAELQYGKSNQT